ncbi:fatty acid--CoA ligase family protein [Phenylobacterium sp. J367]|uniref:class I adenylate-forming enzyme family protein n=1 Tax=Phenylobacterium sp. J367 TaxID=2898435 RepID=UPI0027E311E7|nr:fatty acid--CoA ligase family protein [Phenylobacterium sp. J367]
MSPEVLSETLPGLLDASDPQALSLPDAPALRCIVSIDGTAKGFAPDTNLSLGDGPLDAGIDPEDAALLMYTSGTTAKPKGCIIPHRALYANAEAIADRFALGPDDVWWCPLPMFHIGGLLFLLMMLQRGGFYVGMSYFDPDTAFDQIEETAPTVLYPLFPTITLALTEHPRFKGLALPRLRYVFDVAPEDVQRKIQAAFPQVPLLSAFGMTETSGTVAYTLPTHSETARLTSCGTALTGWEVKVLDPETRAILAAGEKGELAVRGVGLFKGYFNDPVHTAKSFTADGYFMTGDSGMLDAEGLVYFFGRLKDQLKVGGENVSALEVESVLASHPAINLAQVVGAPDDKYGEVVAAFIELKPGQTLTADEAIAYCRERIARFKVPRHVRFVREWPMSATKIQKFRLKAELERELAQEASPA